MNKNCSLRDIWEENKNNDSPDFEKCIYDSIEITYLYTNHFDWEKYLSSYNDIVIEERNEFYAYKHWIECGNNENRCTGKKYSQEPYERFEWESYLTMNPDLSELKTETELFHHWITHGIFENRKVTEIEKFNTKTNTIEAINIKDKVHLFENNEANKTWIKTLEHYLHVLNWKQYLETYQDLVSNGIDTYVSAFLHWCSHGNDEGRIGKKFEKLDITLKNKIEEKTKELMDGVYEKNIEEKTRQRSNMPIYIINLLKRIDKKIDIQYQIKKLNIKNDSFFKAYGKNDKEVNETFIKYNEDFQNKTIKTTFYKSKVEQKIINSIGAIGLIKSTIELFKEIEKTNNDYVMILEDDVCFHKSWNYMLKPIKNCLFHDLIYIGYNSYNENINRLLVNDETTIIRTVPHDRSLGTFYGTYGYICNSKFRNIIIQNGLSWFTKNNATLDYGFNILNWEKLITVATITGEPLVYPKIDDPESINQDRKNSNDFYKLRQIIQSNYLQSLKPNIKFVFIVPSYNNEKWIEYNIKSILSQTYKNWELIYINDCSNDNTDKLFKELTKNVDNKITYLKNNKKYGQAFNRYTGYNMCEDNDFCILLDGDDWLNHKYVLQYLSLFITMHDVDITYGSFLQYNKGKINHISWIPRDYDQNIIENKEYRNDIWRAMHLRVMKAQHLKHISALDFIDDEYKFIQSSTDMVESYASLELCQGRHKKINEHLMIYNRENSMYYPTSYYDKTDKIKKEQIINNVKNISPYQDKVKYDKIAIIDIDNDNYKDMIQFYKKDLIRKMDLFLVRGSIIQYYINKLNAYQNIVYLTHYENYETDYKIEEVEENKVEENIEKEEQDREQENVIKEIVTDKIDKIVDSLQNTEGNISKSSSSKTFDIHSNFSSSQSFINNEFIEDEHENQNTDKDYLPQSYN